MRIAPDHQGNHLFEAEEPTRDLVLGLPALLGIFVAVALICAVCFGFGYSSSRRFHLPAQQLASAAPAVAPSVIPARPEPVSTPAAEPEADDNPAEAAYPTPTPQAGPDEAPPSYQSLRPAAKPAPGVTAEASQEPAVQRRSLLSSQPAPQTQAALPQNTPQPAYTAPVETMAGAPRGVPLAIPAQAQLPAPIGSGLMVQIAAVTRAADAQTLANALRHDGFDAIVRTSTDDRFFHVQIGPFASNQAAKAMRSRLADNGYNAFIKP